jgi:hypothetical protein
VIANLACVNIRVSSRQLCVLSPGDACRQGNASEALDYASHSSDGILEMSFSEEGSSLPGNPAKKHDAD